MSSPSTHLRLELACNSRPTVSYKKTLQHSPDLEAGSAYEFLPSLTGKLELTRFDLISGEVEYRLCWEEHDVQRCVDIVTQLNAAGWQSLS